ncbi:MAG: Flp pilus assembly complex ATPase component TadA [Saccharofermentans sp.]|nr:Flp pilus assembly complex ATPase component TadA [Saccharofermentans sp.]
MKNQEYDLNSIKEQITYYVLNSLKNEIDPSDDRLKEIIADVIGMNISGQNLTLSDKKELAVKVFNSMRRLDVIEPLMQDPTITEIMVNGPDNIFYERGGKLYKSDIKFSNSQSLQTIISCFFANQNRPLNEANPISDLRLPDGSRANAVLPPVAPDGPILTIRKFTGVSHDIVTLIRQGFLSDESARFLCQCVKNKKTLFLCGGTGSGKTTLLNTLSSFIPSDERVITIEDSAELNLQGIDNLVRMEARLPGPDGTGEVNIAHMIRAALRMRPDRIIIGEVRGAETADLMNAINTGHKGSLSSGHANSCLEMMERLTSMAMAGSSLPFNAIVSQLSMGIDILVHITRDKTGKRYVDEICYVPTSTGTTFNLEQLFVNIGGTILEKKCTDTRLEELCRYN